ncbi:MAG: hypothetical protein HYX52_01045 [Chloroflexi bacterium]|nr:hypothetical protein [Chloroflexota bacterium]
MTMTQKAHLHELVEDLTDDKEVIETVSNVVRIFQGGNAHAKAAALDQYLQQLRDDPFARALLDADLDDEDSDAEEDADAAAALADYQRGQARPWSEVLSEITVDGE